MPRRSVPEEEKRLVWKRIMETARAHHEHYQKHGIVSLVARDAGVKPQSAQRWKDAKNRPSMGLLTRLAATYGVSASYLAGAVEDPQQTAPPDETQRRSKMVELVEDVLSNMMPDAPNSLVLELCDLALELLDDGQEEDLIIAALYKRVKAAKAGEQANSASPPSPDR